MPDPTSGLGGFVDSAGRRATDAPLPVLLDQYPDPLPIMYLRTTVAGTALVGFHNSATIGGTQPLQDSVTNANVTAQYDLAQLLDYTTSKIATKANNANSYHGLMGIGNTDLSDTIMETPPLSASPKNMGSNAVAYFEDPNFIGRSIFTYNPAASNTHAAPTRNKDGYLLISAGQDRLYGTADDVIYPGSLAVSQ